MTRETDQMQVLLERSARRQRVALRRGRRAAGLHPDPLDRRIGKASRRVLRSQALRLGAVWSLALALGVAGGLWLEQNGLPAFATASQVAQRSLPVADPQTVDLDLELPAPSPVVAAPPRATLAGPAPAAEVARSLSPEGERTLAPGASPAPAPAAPPPAVETAAAVAPVAPLQAAPLQAAPLQAAPVAAGRPTWLANAVPAAVDLERPMIAVVIDDLGLRRQATRAAIALPGPLSLAFLAYAEDLDDQTESARAAGHELLLHQPMEPEGAQDPGPGALLTSLSGRENVARLTAALDRLPQVVGINNHMGSRFTASPVALEPVLRTLQRRGLLFLDSRTTGESVGLATARRLGVPSVGRDVFLDHRVSAGRPYVERQLAEVEAIARVSGAAVAIGHPHAATLEALRDWIPALQARGFQLVPISAVVQARQSRQLAEANRGR
ncbi:divergent polysaccharide deacetylase family protein [Algihabitans albus]|uniref:divergent polysaccharide deacetylase family protein n=1 Tax=Algihabitans albus TaxID=2164067 RepID=UPI0035CE9974